MAAVLDVAFANLRTLLGNPRNRVNECTIRLSVNYIFSYKLNVF